MDRDVRHVLRGVTFEWNRAKAIANELKHGVSFELACEVFFDPLALVVDATEPDEARDAAIGRTQSQAILFVVHVIRDEEEIVRIISARHATSQERGTYEQF